MNLLAYVFGSDSQGESEAARAASSNQQFVRNQDHLALWSEGARGRVLNAREALELFGMQRLVEAVDYGSAILTTAPGEPALTLSQRREALGLDQRAFAKATKRPLAEIQDSEDPKTRSPIRVLEPIAAALGLDERVLGLTPGAKGDRELAVRLKTLGRSQRQRLSAKTVLAFAEGGPWVIATQDRLQRALGLPAGAQEGFVPSGEYGGAGDPAWQHGFSLAHKNRRLLGLDETSPIDSMRDLCDRLGIPLLQAELPDTIVGATLEVHQVRGVLVNIRGDNENVWVRRATIAHELGHLLWDPSQELEHVKVDSFKQLEAPYQKARFSPVEARANAFSIELLAPQREVARRIREAPSPAQGLQEVMETFGLSFTAARYHAWNALKRSVEWEEFSGVRVDPSDEWKGREDFTTDYFPIEETGYLRRGAGLLAWWSPRNNRA
jgi:hypothetical protein